MKSLRAAVALVALSDMAWGQKCEVQDVAEGAAPKWSAVLLVEVGGGMLKQKCGAVVTAVRNDRIEIATAKHCAEGFHWLVVGASSVASNLTTKNPPEGAVFVKTNKAPNWKLPQAGKLDLALLELQYPPAEFPNLNPKYLPVPTALPALTRSVLSTDRISLYVWAQGGGVNARLRKLWPVSTVTHEVQEKARYAYCGKQTLGLCGIEVEGFGIRCGDLEIQDGYSGGAVVVSDGRGDSLAAVISTSFGTVGQVSTVQAGLLDLTERCGFNGKWSAECFTLSRGLRMDGKGPSILMPGKQ